MDDRAERRIEKALAELGSEYHPPTGWEARVLAAAHRRRRRRRLMVVGSIAAAAAALLLLWKLPGRSLPEIRFERIPGVVPSRGEGAHVGDSVQARLKGGRHQDVWVYRDDRLVFTCQGATCIQDGDALTATVPLDLPGHYVFVGLVHDEPLAAPRGDYDKDLASAQQAGIHHVENEWTVR